MFDEKFWLAIAFLAFAILFIKYVLPHLLKNIDNKSREIAKELLDAKEAKEKALALLEASKKHLDDAMKASEKLISEAEIESRKLFEEAKAAAEAEIAKKMQAVQDRIKFEEERVVREMKVKIISSAISAVQADMQNTKKDRLDNLIKKSANDISKVIH